MNVNVYSCVQQLPPKKSMISFNLDHLSIIERPKILKGQIMFSQTCYSNQATECKPWLKHSQVLDDGEYISNTVGYHEIVTASIVKVKVFTPYT